MDRWIMQVLGTFEARVDFGLEPGCSGLVDAYVEEKSARKHKSPSPTIWAAPSLIPGRRFRKAPDRELRHLLLAILDVCRWQWSDLSVASKGPSMATVDVSLSHEKNLAV